MIIERDTEYRKKLLDGQRERMGVGVRRTGIHVSDLVFCLVPDQRVLASGVTGATMRDYEGDIVVVKTATGNELTVTPNHPILTREGWVAAGALNPGDEIAEGAIREWSALHPHNVKVPTQVSEVFSTLSHMGHLAQTPGSRNDFHGDGRDSEINVVTPCRCLSNTFDTESVQSLHNFIFPRINVRSSHLSGARRLFKRFFCAGAAVTACCYQIGESLFTQFLPQVRRNLLPVRKVTVSVDVGSSFGSRSQGEPTRTKVIAQERIVYTESFADVRSRFPGEITLVKLLQVKRKLFKGHVYNLSTESECFLAENIVTHNCTRKAWAERISEFTEAISDNTVLTFLRGLSHEDLLAEAMDQIRSGFCFPCQENYAMDARLAETQRCPRETCRTPLLVGTIDWVSITDDLSYAPVEMKSTLKSARKELVKDMPWYLDQLKSYLFMHDQQFGRVCVLHIMGDYARGNADERGNGPRAELVVYKCSWESATERSAWGKVLARRKIAVEGPTLPALDEDSPAHDYICDYCLVGELLPTGSECERFPWVKQPDGRYLRKGSKSVTRSSMEDMMSELARIGESFNGRSTNGHATPTSSDNSIPSADHDDAEPSEFELAFGV